MEAAFPVPESARALIAATEERQLAEVPPGTILCELCGGVVERTAAAYRRVTGWEHPREQGGTNHITLRTPLNEWAHAACISLAKSGITVGQSSLLAGES